jgi:hypothetical protein
VDVHLVPIGRGRFELYAEPADPEPDVPGPDAGRLRRWAHRAGEQWHQFVDTARLGEATGRFARWRDALVCRLADSIDEQRTLWALRRTSECVVLHPSTLGASEARAMLDRILVAARRHHGWWLAIDLVLFIASGILFFVPGPNIVAYYIGFRVFGHLQSWRGARQALAGVRWTLQESDALSELATLAGVPHRTRAERVHDIARMLDLPHLPAFFERAAA